MLTLLLACVSTAAETPSVTIASPLDGATVCGTPLAVKVDVDGIVLVDPYGDVTDPGTGHVDVMLNGQDVAMTATERFEVDDVPEGAYQLKVELSNADHTPIAPYAGDLIYVSVSEAACTG